MMIACPVWEEQKKLKCTFPVICEHDKIYMSHIYPIKQRAVKEIYQSIQGDERIVSVILFGSAIDMRCHRDSDLDLMVELCPQFVDVQTKNEVSEKIQQACGWNADILWRDRIQPTDRVYKEIKRGVILYEQIIGKGESEVCKRSSGFCGMSGQAGDSFPGKNRK